MLQIRQLALFLVILCAYAGTAKALASCLPTPEHPLGGNYIPNTAAFNTNIGKGLTLKGRVLSATSCEPIADAVIEYWQAGKQGKYEKRLRAFTFSLPDGSYRLETEWPNMPIPHIHFIVTADNQKKLITQWLPESKTDDATFDLVLKPAISF